MPGVETLFSHPQDVLQMQFVVGSAKLRIKSHGENGDRVTSFDLDRDEINALIRKLREVRDYSYGADA